MKITKYTHSIASIPRQAGTFWIKTRRSDGTTVVISGRHSFNVYQTILLMDKAQLAKQYDYQSIWFEVLLDTDFI